ncbi:DUF397 domain-containing protein (plasmid) [Nonomuraea sp. CA-143628]|uniref:DUF397 domain-containing protein n=1 Tax=Nonomuraea sp. CA-143628 TaxID=3239997 RepID=UPI003D8FF637
MSRPVWRKSSRCKGASNCVEVMPLDDGDVAMRDGKDPEGPCHVFTADEWAVFLAGVRDGEFDLAVLASDAKGSARASGASVTAVEPSQVSR